MSLHGDATRMLRSWRASDAGQERLRRDYLSYLAAHSDAMWRQCRPAHLTASALVVDSTGTQVMLVQHSKVGRWLQTGGHCEPADATLGASALREATEETGISGLRLVPGPVRLDRHPAPCGASHHLDVQFLAIADLEQRAGGRGSLPFAVDHSDPVAWFPADGLPAETDESVRGLVGDSIKRLHEVGEQVVEIFQPD